MANITGPNGGDATKAIVEGVEDHAKKLTRDAMDIWFAASQDHLIAAAEERAGGSGSRTTQQKENDLTDMLDEFQPVEWDETAEAWVFVWAHRAAIFHEFGARSHEIEAKEAEVLAFEWPDAPQEIREKFEKTFPTVFFQSVEHPGVPAIAPIRRGRDEARSRLKQAGYDVKTFGEAST